MNIPRYWARAEGDTPADYEGGGHLAVWGWSAESRVDAERHARQRLTELLDHLRAGQGWPKGYTYGSRPRREEILQELRDRTGEPFAFVTRTHYGSEVLKRGASTVRGRRRAGAIGQTAPRESLRIVGRARGACARTNSRDTRTRIARQLHDLSHGRRVPSGRHRFSLRPGFAGVHDEADDVIHLHDAKTRADAGLPLA